MNRMKSIAIVLALVLVLNPYMGAGATILYGQVSHIKKTRGISCQLDVSTNPPMTSLPSYIMPRGDELIIIGATDLGSTCLAAEIPTMAKLASQLAAHLQDHLAAIGVEFAPWTNIVNSVDPASDCWGIVVAGDKLLSIDGENPKAYILARKNYGGAGEAVLIRFKHPGERAQKVFCRRSPVQSFKTAYRNGMLQQHQSLSRTSNRERDLLVAKNALSAE